MTCAPSRGRRVRRGLRRCILLAAAVPFAACARLAAVPGHDDAKGPPVTPGHVCAPEPATSRPRQASPRNDGWQVGAPQGAGAYALAEPPSTARPERRATADGDRDAPHRIALDLTNPFADRITIPINQNLDFKVREERGWNYRLSVQPVIPIHLNSHWNVISRSIVPVFYEDALGSQETALGDVTQAFFLSPTFASDYGWVWGLGPIVSIPSATRPLFGSDQWGLGPNLGLLRRQGPWTVGFLGNHLFSLGHDEEQPELNTTFLQPSIDYTTDSDVTFSVNTESVYDWTHDRWTVPINAVVRKLFAVNDDHVSVALGARWYPESPNGHPAWGLRLGVTLLLR
jgi:hypothetical protein